MKTSLQLLLACARQFVLASQQKTSVPLAYDVRPDGKGFVAIHREGKNRIWLRYNDKNQVYSFGVNEEDATTLWESLFCENTGWLKKEHRMGFGIQESPDDYSYILNYKPEGVYEVMLYPTPRSVYQWYWYTEKMANPDVAIRKAISAAESVVHDTLPETLDRRMSPMQVLKLEIPTTFDMEVVAAEILTALGLTKADFEALGVL